MQPKRILFTGGAGKAGRHVVPWLLSQGHTVINVDRVPLEHAGVHNLSADVTDSGQMFNVMTSYAHLGELDAGIGVPRLDAVVHFAAVPRILLVPDNETFRVNTLGTYNVIEAAVKLGVPKIVIASSETTYGVCFADGHRRPPRLPVEEDVETTPMDSYGLSKVVNERTAEAFQRRAGIDIYALRIGNVIEPHEYETLFPAFLKDPALRERNIFNYMDARDLGQIVERCVQTDGLGYQVFNAANDTNSVALTTAEILQRFYPGVPVTRALGETEALFSNRKAREVLGFREAHDWRAHVSG